MEGSIETVKTGFTVDFSCDIKSSGGFKVKDGRLTCPHKRWNFNMARKDSTIYQGLLNTLRKIPSRLAEDATRLRAAPTAGIRLSNSRLGSIKAETEFWWKESFKSCPDQHHQPQEIQTSQSRPVSVRGLLGPETWTQMFQIDVDSNNITLSRPMWDFCNHPNQESRESWIDLTEAVGLLISLLARCSATFDEGNQDSHEDLCDQIMEETKMLASACIVYLDFYSAAWVKMQVQTTTITDVLSNQLMQATKALNRENQQFFTMPPASASSSQTTETNPSHQGDQCVPEI